MTKSFTLEGIFPALVTPFTRAGKEFNEPAYRDLIERVLPDVDGVVPCGSTGEFVSLRPVERRRAVEVAVETVTDLDSSKKVIAGTGGSCTQEAIAYTTHAADVGADAALIVTPYFLRASDKGLYQHYWQLSRATDLPIALYNIPQVTDAVLSRRVVEDLAQIDTVVGMKDSSGNLTYTMEILEKVRGDMNVVIGHDEVVLPALAAGCSGMILASAQVFPKHWRRVLDAVHAGDLETARATQFEVQKLARIFCRLGGGVPVKAALRMLGVKIGFPRLPLRDGGNLIHEDREEIRLELEKLGMLTPSYPAATLPADEPGKRFALTLGLDESGTDPFVIGTAGAGDGDDAVVVDLLGGRKSGPLAAVFAEQLTYPRQGFEALPAMLEPNLSVKPHTLILPYIELRNLRQANMIYGPTQAAISRALADAAEAETVPHWFVDDGLMIASILVRPQALDRQAIYRNIYTATTDALGTITPPFATLDGGDA